MSLIPGMGSQEELREQVRIGQEMLGNAMALIAEQRDEIADLRTGIGQCYRMLLSEPDTKGALFKAENILRDLITPNLNSTTP